MNKQAQFKIILVLLLIIIALLIITVAIHAWWSGLQESAKFPETGALAIVPFIFTKHKNNQNF